MDIMKRKAVILLSMLLAVFGLTGFLTKGEINSVKAADTPAKPARYTVLVLDNSKDLQYQDGENGIMYTAPAALPYLKKTTKEFLNNLFQQGNNEYVAIVDYEDEKVYKICDFSNNLSKLEKAIDNISEPEADLIGKRGYGNLAAAIEKADSLLSTIQDNVNKNAVIMTTGLTGCGEYNYSGKYNSETVGSNWENGGTKVRLYAYANVAYESVSKLKKQANVYSVGMFQIFDDMPEKGQNIVQFFQLVAKDLASDGKYFEASNMDLLSETMGSVFDEFVNQEFEVHTTSDDSTKGAAAGGDTYKIGELVTLTATAEQGWEFAGWYEGNKCVSKQNPYTFYPVKDINLTAKFERKKVLAMATTPNSACGTVKAPGQVEIESTVTYKATPKAGYKFVGWYKGSELVSTDTTYKFTITENTILKGMFEWDDSLSDNDLAEAVIASDLPILLATGKAGNKQVSLSYTKVPDAMYYEVYWSVCDGKENYTKIAEKRSGTNMGLIQTKLNPKKAYKYFVSAYRYKNGAKEYIAKSPVAHVALKKHKGTNVKSITVSKKNVTLKNGKKTKIQAKYKKENSKKPFVSHEKKYRYITSNKNVATVSQTGQITAKGKGKCSVYVVANNGMYQKVKVTVK